MLLTEILMISATALSPIIAVQVTRRLDERNEVRGRKLAIYKTLMATRAYTIAPAHVEALNRIDIEFSDNSKQVKAVRDVWDQYLDHLGNKAMQPDAWEARRVDLLVDLLYVMGQALGYGFNKTRIKNGTYAPIAHGRLLEEQEKVRQFVIELLEGKRALPMNITNIPEQDKPAQEELKN